MDSSPRSAGSASHIQAFLVVVLLLGSGMTLFASPATATTSPPIYIFGDSDLADQAATNGWPGSGTQADPYIIEGLTISATSAHGVEIHNTHAHLILRDLTITGTGQNFGIFVQGVRNLAVEDTTIKSVTIGMYVNMVAASRFTGNTITNTVYAFSVVTSNTNTFTANEMTGQEYGFFVLFSKFNMVRENTITASAVWGIFVNEGGTNTFRDNVISSSADDAIHLKDSPSNTVTGNQITTSKVGIRILDANNIIEKNKITHSTVGVLIEGVVDVKIRENTIIGAQTGVEIKYAAKAHLRDNDIRNGTIGVNLFQSNDNKMDSDRLTNLTTGVLAFASLRNTFDDLVLEDNLMGIHIRSSRLNVYTGLYAENNTQAIRIDNSRSETIQLGTFVDNRYAITLSRGLLHELRHTNLTDNEIGLRILDSNSNRIWDNLFENDQNVEVTGAVQQTWNVPKAPGNNIIGGVWLGGNWWHDYTGVDLDGDGLGDLPHGPFAYGGTGSSALANALGFVYGPDDGLPLVHERVRQDRV